MVKLVCGKCNYRFEAKKPEDCPYCGESGGIELEKSASELIDEVSKILKE